MKIKAHRLVDSDRSEVPYVRSPNQGGALSSRYVIIHYTAGASADSSIRHLTSKDSKASAHVVIGRDGAITQLVPFNRVAWHAGRSRWLGLTGLNRHSIGIELDNAGPLDRGENGWFAWFGRQYSSEDVMVAAHKHDGVERGWHRYTERQISSALDVCKALRAHYEISDVLGHDDIAPERKKDPGPAFPMESFRDQIIGRSDDEFQSVWTITELNIREGPGVYFDKLAGSPLARGTRLQADRRDGSWYFVNVIGRSGDPELSGWVHGDYVSDQPIN